MGLDLQGIQLCQLSDVLWMIQHVIHFFTVSIAPQVKNLLEAQLLTWNGPTYMYQLLHLPSLCVKGLTWRCNVWNDKDYKLVLTILNFSKVVENPPTITHHVPHGPTTLITRWGDTFTPLKGCHPLKLTTYAGDAQNHPLVHPFRL